MKLRTRVSNDLSNCLLLRPRHPSLSMSLVKLFKEDRDGMPESDTRAPLLSSKAKDRMRQPLGSFASFTSNSKGFLSVKTALLGDGHLTFLEKERKSQSLSRLYSPTRNLAEVCCPLTFAINNFKLSVQVDSVACQCCSSGSVPPQRYHLKTASITFGNLTDIYGTLI